MGAGIFPDRPVGEPWIPTEDEVRRLERELSVAMGSEQRLLLLAESLRLTKDENGLITVDVERS